jgi:hypothetical protein
VTLPCSTNLSRENKEVRTMRRAAFLFCLFRKHAFRSNFPARSALNNQLGLATTNSYALENGNNCFISRGSEGLGEFDLFGPVFTVIIRKHRTEARGCIKGLGATGDFKRMSGESGSFHSALLRKIFFRKAIGWVLIHARLCGPNSCEL